MRRIKGARLAAAVGTVAILAAACGSGEPKPNATGSPSPAPSGISAATPAADLAVRLQALFGEHVMLAATASGRFLAGDRKARDAAVGALDANSGELSSVVGTLYGAEAGGVFTGLWQRHVGLFFDYVAGAADGDAAAMSQAIAALTAYAGEFAAYLESTTGNTLPKTASQPAITEHVNTLKAVVDAQAARNFTAAYSHIHRAYTHMTTFGGALAAAVVKQKSTRGSVDNASAKLRSSLVAALTEHAWLEVAAASEVAFRSTPGFGGAAAVVETNTRELSTVLGGVYGTNTQQEFEEVWKQHVTRLIDYVTAVLTSSGDAEMDAEKRKKAVDALNASPAAVAAFIQKATAGLLSADAVSRLVADHITGVRAAVDAIVAKDFGGAYASMRTAAKHMRTFGDPLAEAIIRQFPEKFAA